MTRRSISIMFTLDVLYFLMYLSFRMTLDLERMDSDLSAVRGQEQPPHPSGLSGAHFMDQVIMPKLVDNDKGGLVFFEHMCSKLENMSAALARDPKFSGIKLSSPRALIGPQTSPIIWADIIWAWFCLGDWETPVLANKSAGVEKEINRLCPQVRVTSYISGASSLIHIRCKCLNTRGV